MKKLIVNADDFGRRPLINQAVAEAVDKKGLLSASLMAGEPYFAEAVEIAQKRPQLGVGVHLTLVNGRPVLPAEEIPTLAVHHGCFCPTTVLLSSIMYRGRLRVQILRKNWLRSWIRLCRPV